MKRPMLWVSGATLLLFLCLRAVCGETFDRQCYCLDDVPERTAAVVTGTLRRVEPKANITYLYITDVSVYLRSREGTVLFLIQLLLFTAIFRKERNRCACT